MAKKKQTPKLTQLEKEIKNIKISKFVDTIKDFTSQIDKLVSVSISLQAKNAELGMQISDLLSELKDITELLKEAGNSDVDKKLDETINELKTLNKNVEKLIKIELAKKIVIPRSGERNE